MSRWWCALLMLLIGAAADEPTLRVDVHRKGDRAAVEQLETSSVVRVTSSTGIGKLTLAAEQGAALPDRVAVKWKYDRPRKFDSLEGLTLTTSRWQVRGSSKQTGKLPFFLPDEHGVFEKDDTKPAGWLDIRIAPVGEELELCFPMRLLSSERKLEIEWIDFYRN